MNQMQATEGFQLGGAWFDASTSAQSMMGYPVGGTVRVVRRAARRPGRSAGRRGGLRLFAPLLAAVRGGVRT